MKRVAALDGARRLAKARRFDAEAHCNRLVNHECHWRGFYRKRMAKVIRKGAFASGERAAQSIEVIDDSGFCRRLPLDSFRQRRRIEFAWSRRSGDTGGQITF